MMAAPRRNGNRALALALALAVLGCLPSLSFIAQRPTTARVQHVALSAEALDRRSFLAGSAGAAALFGSSAAQAADFLGLPRFKGTFERDPNEKLFVGDIDAPESVKAKKLVEDFQNKVETMVTKLKEDDQFDVSPYIGNNRIGKFRGATNLLDELLDDASAAGVQRLQRLMIQTMYIQDEEGPFPVSKKGVVQPRGPDKLFRLKKACDDYLGFSKQYLKFFTEA